MGAPAQISVVEHELMRAMLDHVTSQRQPTGLVLDFRKRSWGWHQRTGPATLPVAASWSEPGQDHDHMPSSPRNEGPHDDADRAEAAAGPLATMRELARERAGVEARLIEVAKEVVAATGAALLADKAFTSVRELSATARKKWRAEAKSAAVAEIQVLLGMGVTNARRLVGLATAPRPVQATVVDALARGEASLDMALRYWARCGSLPAADGADVAEAMFGTDPAAAAAERLDAQGGLKSRPWHEGEYDAALEREALAREGTDVEARREQRRRSRQERDATLRVHDDGVATLTIRCPLTTGAGIYQRVDRTSRSLHGAGDPRTLSQLRADIAGALLLHAVLPLPEPQRGGLVEALLSPADLDQIARILAATPPVQLQVVIPWDTLTGAPAGAASCPAPCCCTTGTATADAHPPPPQRSRPPGQPRCSAPPDHPGRSGPALPNACPGALRGRAGGARGGRGGVAEILGLHHAFITPEHARVLAMQPDTTLARLLVDPADGRLIERSIKTYRPDADMRRQVRAADVLSRMPGSRRPAAWCDLDHEHPYADGGPTSETNLNCKDRRSHTLKTKGWWSTTMAPDRDVTWTTLLGQTETTRCHDYRQYLDQRAPLDPDQAHTHLSQRTDLDDRLDLACQALYAALVHRDPHAHLADPDDHHGASEHDPSLGGWIWVSHTNPDGVRRYGLPPTHPTVADILGIPTEDEDDKEREAGDDTENPPTRTRDTPENTNGQTPDTPWQHRAADDDPPPF